MFTSRRGFTLGAQVRMFLLCVVMGVAITSTVHAEPVLGCPLGIGNGELWVRGAYKIIDHSERYNAQTGFMEDLPDGWRSEKRSVPLRIGYGLTDRWQIAVATTYNEVERHVQTPRGWLDTDAGGWDGWWLVASYKSHESYEPWQGWQESHINWAIGYKFGCTGEDARNGIGNTADALRIGVLAHVDGDEDDSFCQHLTYTTYERAATVEGWPKSGWEFGDRVGYKWFWEHVLARNLASTFGPIGWFQTDPDRSPAGQAAAYRAHMHNLQLGLAWHPSGVDVEHQKLVFAVSWPYSARTSFAPDYALTTTAMWTW